MTKKGTRRMHDFARSCSCVAHEEEANNWCENWAGRHRYGIYTAEGINKTPPARDERGGRKLYGRAARKKKKGRET